MPIKKLLGMILIMLGVLVWGEVAFGQYPPPPPYSPIYPYSPYVPYYGDSNTAVVGRSPYYGGYYPYYNPYYPPGYDYRSPYPYPYPGVAVGGNTAWVP